MSVESRLFSGLSKATLNTSKPTETIVPQRLQSCIFFVNASHVAADVISFAATFFQTSPLAHFVAAPLRIEPAALRFGFFICNFGYLFCQHNPAASCRIQVAHLTWWGVFSFTPAPKRVSFCQRFPRRSKVRFAPAYLYLYPAAGMVPLGCVLIF